MVPAYSFPTPLRLLLLLIVLFAVSHVPLHAQDRAGRLNIAEPVGERTTPKRFALCIGIDGYSAKGGYAPLRFAVADARAMHKAFESLGYEATLMVDDSPAELRPTFQNLFRQIRTFARQATHPDDLLVVSYAGHGDEVATQSGLIPLDFEEEQQVLTIGTLFDQLNSAKCRAGNKLLLLDACRSGADNPAHRMSNGFMLASKSPQTCVVISGCTINQSSIEEPALKHGRLTMAVLLGLVGQNHLVDPKNPPAGEAYPGGDEFLKIGALFDFVARTFRDRGWIDSQSPQKWGIEDSRAMAVLARRDAPKPRELRNADRKLIASALKEAEQCFVEGNYTEMMDYAVTALTIDEKNVAARTLRALAYQQLGFWKKATEESARTLELDPEQPIARLITTTSYLDRQIEQINRSLHIARTRGAFLTTSASAKWTVDISRRLVFALPRQSRMDESIFGPALESLAQVGGDATLGSSQRAESRFLRAEILRRLRQPAKALEELNDAMKIESLALDWQAKLLTSRADIQRREMKSLQAGIDDLTRVIETREMPAKQVTEALIKRAEFFAQVSDAQGHAMADFTRAVEASPNRELKELALFERAAFWEKSGDAVKAVADLREVMSLGGAMFTMAYQERVRVNRDAAPPESAVVDLEMLASEKKVASIDRASAYLARAGIFRRKLKMPEKAVENLSQLLELKELLPSQQAEGLMQRAEIYRDDFNDSQKALADIEQLLLLNDAPAEKINLAQRLKEKLRP